VAVLLEIDIAGYHKLASLLPFVGMPLTWNVTSSTSDSLLTARHARSKPPSQGRRVPIEPRLEPLQLALHKETGGEGALVEVPISHLAEHLQRHLKLAGITRTELFPPPSSHQVANTWAALTFHDLRGTCVTWAAIRGDEPLVIQQRAGHSDFDTTQRYLREAETLGKDSRYPRPHLLQELVASSTFRETIF
jgi:hypothetical protein